MHTDIELQKAYECLKARTGETNTLFSVDTTKALTTEDIKKLLKGLRKYLRDNNIGTFSNKPEIMQLELNRAIKSGRISIDEGNAIKILNKKIGEIQSLSGKSASPAPFRTEKTTKIRTAGIYYKCIIYDRCFIEAYRKYHP